MPKPLSWYTDGDGRLWPSTAGAELIAGMAEPVQCAHCGEIYDLRAVTGAMNYADCSVWRTPCCGREADDRKIVTHYRPVSTEPARVRDWRGGTQ